MTTSALSHLPIKVTIMSGRYGMPVIRDAHKLLYCTCVDLDLCHTKWNMILLRNHTPLTTGWRCFYDTALWFHPWTQVDPDKGYRWLSIKTAATPMRQQWCIFLLWAIDTYYQRESTLKLKPSKSKHIFAMFLVCPLKRDKHVAKWENTDNLNTIQLQ